MHFFSDMYDDDDDDDDDIRRGDFADSTYQLCFRFSLCIFS